LDYAAGDGNLYRYVHNGPINATDPTGLDEKLDPSKFMVLNLADYRCAQCHGSYDGRFKNIAWGVYNYQWSDLSLAQQTMLELGATYRPGKIERGVTRVINGVTLAPVYLFGGVVESYMEGVDAGQGPVLAAVGAPVLTVIKGAEHQVVSTYHIVTGQGTVEEFVDVSMVAVPFAPKIVRLGKGAFSVAVEEAGGNLGGISVTPPKTSPTEIYNRAKHYGKTPTQADRQAIGAGKGQVADHDPPLVKRYYEGDPAAAERPGYTMTDAERRASAADRSRMKVQSQADSNKQGGFLSQWSKQMKKLLGLE
jgi:hypothetical protein